MVIVVIAYNREKELNNLLHSLSKARYPIGNIKLIISIDYSNNQKIITIAENFLWKYGEKEIIKHTENLGLKRHVLFCGDLTKKYSEIILLEDDLYISEGFYQFAYEATKKFENEDNIAGVSLYNYEVNEFASNHLFRPLISSNDNYFMMVPSSWGQTWKEMQWSKFRKWLSINQERLSDFKKFVPARVYSWSDKSWKKLFHMYLSSEKKYIVYPYVSLSTNMGSVGTHNKESNTKFQVSLLFGFKKNYNFAQLNNKAIKYDAFMESENITNCISNDFRIENVQIDYYGQKSSFNQKYVITTNRRMGKILKSWALRLKPYELNILNDIIGDEIFLIEKDNCNIKRTYYFNRISYDFPSLDKKISFIFLIYSIFKSIKNKMSRILKGEKK